MLLGRDYDSVERALTLLTQECMAKQGFKIDLPAPRPATGPLVDLDYRRYTAIQSLSDARKYGYQLPGGEDPTAASGAAVAFQRSLTPAELVALRGARLASGDARYRNGCLGTADRELMGSAKSIRFDGIEAAPQVQAVNLDPQSVNSPAEAKSLHSFADCMGAAGYPDVVDPRNPPVAYGTPGKPSKAQVTEAVAQFGCQRSSGVIDAMRTAEIAFQLHAIDSNAVAFAQIKAELAAVVRRATTIVAG
jgi:hypothetical protein